MSGNIEQPQSQELEDVVASPSPLPNGGNLEHSQSQFSEDYISPTSHPPGNDADVAWQKFNILSLGY